MANKNTRPYQNVKQRSGKGRNRNYAISKKLENTMRIRIDLDRIHDKDSLDTSFLEGRKYQKVQKSSKKPEKLNKETNVSVKKKIETSKIDPKKNKKHSSHNTKYYILLIILGIIAIAFTLFYREFFKKPVKDNNPIPIEEEIRLDKNYLFIGDQYTQDFPFEKLDMDYHYVKRGERELTTQMLLDGLYHYVYQYNPSDVLIQVGFYDLLEGKEESDVIENIEKIVIGIEQNRKYAHVYIQSLYPMNPEMNNFDSRQYRNLNSIALEEFNEQLETLSKKLGVTYIDIYSLLSEEGLLKEEYTDNGKDLTEEAYQEVFALIQKTLNENRK